MNCTTFSYALLNILAKQYRVLSKREMLRFPFQH